MAITTDDIKIRESQGLTDDDDGGGYMTANEIVDGAINNLFPDLSRLDRTYGRVSLRKFFMHVDTDTTDTYYGSMVIIAQQAQDPNISVALFTTGSDSDNRIDAVDRLESYVTLGPRFIGWLWSDQPKGSRQLLIFMPTTQDSPEVNDVLCLFNDKDTVNEFYQYVRITGVEEKEQTFSIGTRKILTIDIGDALLATFKGMEIHYLDETATNIYTTTVSDAASYYGVMTPTEDIASGDTALMVDSIYAQLVPTSQAETSLRSQTPGDAGPIRQSGGTVSMAFSELNGTILHLERAFVPGTLTLLIGSTEYNDQGDKVLLQGSNQAGTIDYATGTITFTSAKSGSGTATFDPGVSMNLTATTLMVPVPTTGQGYTYVAILWPLPSPTTVSVDYMVDGTWYRLRDDGNGFLTPDIEGTGTGRIDYASGQLSLTCAAIPDADSGILVTWGNPTEIVQMAGNVEVDIDPVSLTLAEHPVAPGSLSITWPTGVSSTATLTDDGNGNITGDATGWIVYGTGEVYFKPAQIPVAGGEYTINYQQYALQTENASGISFTLAHAPKPGTVALDVTCTVGGRSHTYTMRDDGQGSLAADGFTEIISQCRSSLADASSYASSSSGSSNDDGGSGSDDGDSYTLNDEEKTVTLVGGGISGTVDYVTGAVTIDLTTATSTTYTVTAQAKSATSETATLDDVWRT